MSTRTSSLDTVRAGLPAARSSVRASNADRVNPVILALRRLHDRAMYARQRRAAIAELSRLDDRMLRDIGVGRNQIAKRVDESLRRQIDSDG